MKKSIAVLGLGRYGQFLADALCRQGADVLVADDDEEIEIDLDDVTSYVAKKAKKEGMGDFDPEDLLFVIQGDFEFNDPEDEDDDE